MAVDRLPRNTPRAELRKPWLEVRDHDYYTQRLRDIAFVHDLIYQPRLMVDPILKECYLKPIIEQLNKRCSLFVPGEAVHYYAELLPQPATLLQRILTKLRGLLK